MIKALLIGLLGMVSFADTAAQNNLPPAYEIKTDTAGNVILDDAYWQMLEDPGGELTIDQVSQSPPLLAQASRLCLLRLIKNRDR